MRWGWGRKRERERACARGKLKEMVRLYSAKNKNKKRKGRGRKIKRCCWQTTWLIFVTWAQAKLTIKSSPSEHSLIDGRMDWWTGGQTDRRTDGWTDGQMLCMITWNCLWRRFVPRVRFQFEFQFRFWRLVLVLGTRKKSRKNGKLEIPYKAIKLRVGEGETKHLSLITYTLITRIIKYSIYWAD